MNKFIFTFLFACLMGQTSFAGILNTTLGDRKIDNVPISTGGQIDVEGRSTNLLTVGAAVRWKDLKIAKPHVYVFELLVDDPTQFRANYAEIQESVRKMSTVALQLTFVRTVEAKALVHSFEEALVANGHDMNSAHFVSLKNAVEASGDVVKGTTFSVVLEKRPDGKDLVSFQNGQAAPGSVAGPTGFVDAFLSMWLGHTEHDKGLDSVKKQLAGE